MKTVLERQRKEQTRWEREANDRNKEADAFQSEANEAAKRCAEESQNSEIDGRRRSKVNKGAGMNE